MLYLNMDEAITVVNAFGSLIEQLDREKQETPAYPDRENFKEDVLSSPDPLSLVGKRYDATMLPFAKKTIREALMLLISHPDIEKGMKSRLRVGLLSLDDFVDAPTKELGSI